MIILIRIIIPIAIMSQMYHYRFEFPVDEKQTYDDEPEIGLSEHWGILLKMQQQ